MVDWLKILFSALAGVITGMLLEPVRHWISNRITMHYARRAIYLELANLLSALADDESGQSDVSKDRLDRLLHLNALEYFYSSKREVLFLLPDFQSLFRIRDILSILRDILNKGAESPNSVYKLAQTMFLDSELQHELNSGEIRRTAERYLKKNPHYSLHPKITISRKRWQSGRTDAQHGPGTGGPPFFR